MEFCWLIERGQSMGQVPTIWWTEDAANREWGGAWTEDARKATCYPSREAAVEAMGRFYFQGEPGTVTSVGALAVEHGFEVERG